MYSYNSQCKCVGLVEIYCSIHCSIDLSNKPPSNLFTYRCDSDTLDHTFFLGGIDVFSHSHQNLSGLSGNTDFVGTIRNVIIDSVRVDMAFPLREVNTVRGILFTSEPMCSDMEVVCSGPHYAGCLDYDLESHCICSGGFNPGTCDEEKSKFVCVCVCVCVCVQSRLQLEYIIISVYSTYYNTWTLIMSHQTGVNVIL